MCILFVIRFSVESISLHLRIAMSLAENIVQRLLMCMLLLKLYKGHKYLRQSSYEFLTHP